MLEMLAYFGRWRIFVRYQISCDRNFDHYKYLGLISTQIKLICKHFKIIFWENWSNIWYMCCMWSFKFSYSVCRQIIFMLVSVSLTSFLPPNTFRAIVQYWESKHWEYSFFIFFRNGYRFFEIYMNWQTNRQTDRHLGRVNHACEEIHKVVVCDN